MIEDIESEFESWIRRNLDSDETIIWTGKPNARFRVGWVNVLSAIFGLFLVMIGLGTVTSALGFESFVDSSGRVIFGAVFLVAGVHLIVGWSTLRLRRQRRVLYLVTNKRAIICFRGQRKSFVSYPIRVNTRLSILEGKEDHVFFSSQYRGNEEDGSVKLIGFEDLEDGKSAYEALRSVQLSLEKQKSDDV